MSKEIIELLEKVLSSKELVLPKGLVKAEHREEVVALQKMYTEVDQALTLLKQPKCKTCGDTKRVPSEYGLTQCSSLPISPLNTKPCPGCNCNTGGDSKKIPLTQGKFAIVDENKYEELSKYKWQALKNGNTYYARRCDYVNGETKIIYMHRQILGAKQGEEVDHVNHNGLDNRVCNVRKCTRSQNSQNRKPQKKENTSKYKGVNWQKRDCLWQAQIKKNGTTIHIGSFNNEIDAATAYDVKAKELFGEFAHLNFPGCQQPKPKIPPHPCNYVNFEREEQQPTAGEFTKEVRAAMIDNGREHSGFYDTCKLFEACDRLDRAEARSIDCPNRPASKTEIEMAKRICDYQDEVRELKQQPISEEIINLLEKAIMPQCSQYEEQELICQALAILKQQPTAGKFTKELRDWYGKNLTSPEEMAKYQRTLEQSWVKSMNELREAFDFIDALEVKVKDLLDAWEIYKKKIITGYGKTFWQNNCLDIEAVIGKAKKEG